MNSLAVVFGWTGLPPGLGPGELLLIGLIAILLFGNRLPVLFDRRPPSIWPEHLRERLDRYVAQQRRTALLRFAWHFLVLAAILLVMFIIPEIIAHFHHR